MDTLPLLIDHLKQMGVLKTHAIIEAFKDIDRKNFVPLKLFDSAYDDEPLPIGKGQTISQPYTIAFMLELLLPQQGDRVLDVGTGSGYTTALLAELVGTKGKVTGVEIIPELVAFGKENLAKYNFPNARIYQAERGQLGRQEDAPYNKILVSASSHGLKDILIDQLQCGGRMVASVEDAIWKIDKLTDGSLGIEKYEGFRFVPLIEN